MAITEGSNQEIKDGLRERSMILEKAKEVGILSHGEYFFKKRRIYTRPIREFSRDSSKD
jgi:hypothetical protein